MAVPTFASPAASSLRRGPSARLRIAVALLAAAATLPAGAAAAADPVASTQAPLSATRGIFASEAPWDGLSQAEKEAVRAQYPGLGARDEPPYPVRGVGPIYRDLALMQQKLALEGDLIMTVHVDARGSPQEVSFYRMPDPYFAKVAAYVLMHRDYKPARCDGQACAGEFRIDYRSPPP